MDVGLLDNVVLVMAAGKGWGNAIAVEYTGAGARVMSASCSEANTYVAGSPILIDGGIIPR